MYNDAAIGISIIHQTVIAAVLLRPRMTRGRAEERKEHGLCVLTVTIFSLPNTLAEDSNDTLDA